jgi:hypothetical protein
MSASSPMPALQSLQISRPPCARCGGQVALKLIVPDGIDQRSFGCTRCGVIETVQVKYW